jgi:hypothetical protein
MGFLRRDASFCQARRKPIVGFSEFVCHKATMGRLNKNQYGGYTTRPISVIGGHGPRIVGRRGVQDVPKLAGKDPVVSDPLSHVWGVPLETAALPIAALLIVLFFLMRGR